MIERRRLASRLFRAIALGEQLIELASGLAGVLLGTTLLLWWHLEPPYAPFLRVAPEWTWAVLFNGGGYLALKGYLRGDRRTRRISSLGGACTWGWMAVMAAAAGTAPVATALLAGLSAGLAADYVRLYSGAR